VRGYFGNAFSKKNRGYGQRGNLRVPRQVVRRILLESLAITTTIQWSHKLSSIETVQTKDDSCGFRDGTKMLMTFSNNMRIEADLVIAADGIRSTVVEHLLPNVPPPDPIGVRLILGLTKGLDHHHLLTERGFYTLANGHRLFVMPYLAPTPLCPTTPRRYMWQLSFLHNPDDNSCNDPTALQQEALQRTKNWHDPVRALIQSTPLDSFWSAPLCDRDPGVVQDALLLSIDKQRQQTPTCFPRVLIIGDALHAMSCFKGQGANQALVDGVAVGKMVRANKRPLSLIRNCMRELVQRTSPIVQASRTSALEWHQESIAETRTFPFAGIGPDAKAFLQYLDDQDVRVETTDDLDCSILNILREQSEFEYQKEQVIHSSPPLDWSEAVVDACLRDDTSRLRELTWNSSESNWMRDLRFGLNDDTVLHLASSLGHVYMTFWLATEAGCECFAKNLNGNTSRDVASKQEVSSLLKCLEVAKRKDYCNPMFDD
jgi:2-polyprenyl-6-methoxyphenol hydroxylase-like FAD-dependent oxidoreductase